MWRGVALCMKKGKEVQSLQRPISPGTGKNCPWEPSNQPSAVHPLINVALSGDPWFLQVCIYGVGLLTAWPAHKIRAPKLEQSRPP